MAVKSIVLGSLLSVTQVFGHSWLHCTDYGAAINGQDYDDSQCSGYIRNWQNGWGAPSFAADLGINYFGGDGSWCQTALSSDISSMYTTDYPYADWYAGQTYRMVWPAKNHANYDCFANIPDTSMKLYYNPTVNPTADGTTLPSDDWVVLHDFQDGCTPGTDGCGFQNCPEFCEDTDGAPCYGDYTVDGSMFDSDGFYTIMWYWIFNPGSPYVTCFEVYVHTSGSDGGGVGDDDDDDTTGDDDDDTTGDDDDDDDDSSRDYIVQIPVCYDGMAYDKDTLENGANSAFEEDDDVDFSVISYLIKSTDSWNATIQTYTHDSIMVTESALEDSAELCGAIEDEFGTGTCYICDEGAIKVFYANGASRGGGSGSNDSDAAVVILWAIILTIVILLLVFGICHYLQKKNYIVCTDNSIVWQGANGAAATNAPRPSGGQTTTGAGARPQHLRAVPSASALATHDVQTHQVIAERPAGRPAGRPPVPPPVPTH